MMEALGEAPPTLVESMVTEDAIVKALREVLPSMDADTATLKAVMQKLAVRFGMEFLDFKAQWRPRIKALLPELLELCMRGDVSENEGEMAEADAQEEDEEDEFDLRPSKRTERTIEKRNAVVDASDEEEEDNPNDRDASDGEVPTPEDDDDEDEDVAPVKKRLTTSDKSRTRKRRNKEAVPPAKKPKTTKQADPPGLASLKELGRAAGVLNPQLYKLMKGASPSEAEDILRERLQDANVTFQGSYPTSRDISVAKRKHAKEKDLEGIDTSLIITGGRSRRGGGQRISYKEERISGEEDNDEDEEEDDDDKEDADEDDSAGSDSSEASF